MTVSDYARRPAAGEYAPYFDQYMNLATETDIVLALEQQMAEYRGVLEGHPDSMMKQLHEPYTWTITQAMGHVVDNERIFGYRAARFACGDTTPLAGYEQDDFVANFDYSGVPLTDLLDELDHLRKGNLAFYRRLQPEYWDRGGEADGKLMSVRAIAYLLVGHIRHHLNIFAKRLAT